MTEADVAESLAVKREALPRFALCAAGSTPQRRFADPCRGDGPVALPARQADASPKRID